MGYTDLAKSLLFDFINLQSMQPYKIYPHRNHDKSIKIAAGNILPLGMCVYDFRAELCLGRTLNYIETGTCTRESFSTFTHI